MLNIFIESTQNPLVLMLIIIFTSYILEDAAIVGAALLVADSSLSYTSGLIAIFLGIFSGDLILYYIGALSHKFPWAQRKLESKKGQSLKLKLHQKAFLSIFIIRFIPGLRSIGYLACGALKVKLTTFLLSIAFASIIWCGLIYSGIYWLGDALWLADSPWRWLLAPILLVILWSANKKINESLRKDNLLERT